MSKAQTKHMTKWSKQSSDRFYPSVAMFSLCIANNPQSRGKI